MDANSQRARDMRPELVFEDGLGPRYRWTAAADSEHMGLEMHLLRASLAGAPAFEFALRERVARLSKFSHPSFPTVHGVERGSGRPPELLLFSDAAAGVRLSVLLEDAYTSGIPLDCDAALSILRQLVDAVAALHSFALDVSHGALSTERLHIVAPDRLLVVDHALGAALQQLRYPAEQYWSELRVAVPSVPQPPVFDQRLDVVQIGALGVALLRGYPLEAHEWQGDLAEALGATRALSKDGQPVPLPPGIRGWLSRALQLNPLYSFSSAVDAKAGLDALFEERGGADRRHLAAFLARCSGEVEPFWTSDEEYPRAFKPPEVLAPIEAARLTSQTRDADAKTEGNTAQPDSHATDVQPQAVAVQPEIEVASAHAGGLLSPADTASSAPEPHSSESTDAGAFRVALQPDVEPEPPELGLPHGEALEVEPPHVETPQVDPPQVIPAVEPSRGDAPVDWPATNSTAEGVAEPDVQVSGQAEAAPTETERPHSDARNGAFVNGRAARKRSLDPETEDNEFDLAEALTGEDWPRIARDGRPVTTEAPEAFPEPDLLGIDARLANSPVEHSNESIEQTTNEHATVRRRVRWLAGFIGLFCVGATSGVVFAWSEPVKVPPLKLGVVRLSSAPAGVDAYVNNSYRGLTPLTIVLPPGAHVIELRGETTRRMRIQVSPGLTVSQFVDLPNSGQPITNEHAETGAAFDFNSPGSMLSGDGIMEVDDSAPVVDVAADVTRAN